MLPLQARADLRTMAMKGYSAFPKAPALLEPHHQIVLCHIQDTCWGGLSPLQRSSRCILQPQLTGQTMHEGLVEHYYIVMTSSIYQYYIQILRWSLMFIKCFLLKTFIYLFLTCHFDNRMSQIFSSLKNL